MDIYHSAYTQYIDLMGQLREDVQELVSQSYDESTKFGATKEIIEQIDNTIDTASGETFLPTGELLNITKELFGIKSRMSVKTPATEAMLRQCFRTLNKAAFSLKQITEDCALIEANELTEQEM
ncbi:MAG: hypothetical protein J6T11_02575 [Bacteroidaceae bacterium]|nr:hypothetical protein [Bacteroidaceae bacterium]